MVARLCAGKLQRAVTAAWPYVRITAAAVPAALFVKNVVGFPATVYGNSMLPSLHGGGPGELGAGRGDDDAAPASPDVAAAFAFLGLHFRDVIWLGAMGPGARARLRRGDVVVLQSAARPGKLVVKRVVGLPGDCVAAERGRGRAVVLPPGHMWVEGDNASCSHDSTHFGAVPLALIVGRATRVIWPPWRAGRICSAPAAPVPVPAPLPLPRAQQEGPLRQARQPSLVGRLLRTEEDWQWASAAVPEDE